VDDEVGIREILRDSLENLVLEVEETEDGYQAFKNDLSFSR
jgi:hypothetical protein